MVQYNYGWEKLYLAVLGLACGRGTIQVRLCNAFVGGLHLLKVHDDLPDEDKKEFNELYELVTREEPVGEEGSLQATIMKMSDEDVKQCIEKIVSIYDHVTRYQPQV